LNAYVPGATGMTTGSLPEEKSVTPVIEADENVTLCVIPSLFVNWTVAPGVT
jgi:hypothetical protein